MTGSMVRAFAEDPVWVAMFPSPEKREPGTGHLFGFMLRYAALCGEVYTTSGFEGAVVWLPAGFADVGGASALRAGALSLPFAIGFRATRNMQKLGETTTRLRTTHCRGDHWHVAMLGVDPGHQGKGLGRALLTPKMEWCRRHGLPVWLETEAERNVRFYERLGFEVREEAVVPGLEVKLWGMLKEPG